MLELLERLIPCDAICGRRYADDGHLVESIDLPGHHPDEPYTLHVEFRNGDDVIDFGLDRTRRPFDGRDVAVLTMLAPLLRRVGPGAARATRPRVADRSGAPGARPGRSRADERGHCRSADRRPVPGPQAPGARVSQARRLQPDGRHRRHAGLRPTPSWTWSAGSKDSPEPHAEYRSRTRPVETGETPSASRRSHAASTPARHLPVRGARRLRALAHGYGRHMGTAPTEPATIVLDWEQAP